MVAIQDVSKLAALYVRVECGTDASRALSQLNALARDLGLLLFDVYIDQEQDDGYVGFSMLEQLVIDVSNNCFSTVLRMDVCNYSTIPAVVQKRFERLAEDGVRLITLNSSCRDNCR